MKKLSALNFILPLSLVVSVFAITAVAKEETTASSQKPVYGDYQNWRLLGVSHRQDKKTLRAILGNDIAIAAARKTGTQALPDGAILAKVAWKESIHPNWQPAIVSGEFEKAEAMIKDSKKYASTGGWGFAFWKGKELLPFPEAKAKECFACHTAVKDHDYVFTASALQ